MPTPSLRRAKIDNDEIKLAEAAQLLGQGNDDVTLNQAGDLLKRNGKCGRTLAWKLFKAGAIQGRQPTPKVLFLSRASVLAWRARTSSPDFWESPEGLRIRDLLKGY